MTHPIPPGTRDVLPDEMRELRRLQTAFTEVCEARGYGEVATPTIEYYEVLARGDRGGEAAAGAGPSGASLPGAPIAYRFFDERGELLAMRSDMTIPIARMASSRFAGAELPLRFFYMGRAHRAIRPQRGQMREFMQLGIELIGAEAPGGTAEVVEVLVAALDAVGLPRAVVGLGDADLYRQLLAEIGVEGDSRAAILDELAAHDLVGLEAEVRALGLGDTDRDILLRLPNMRGGAEVLDRARDLGGRAVERATSRLSATFGALAPEVADRVQLDLGLLRDLGYYTGAILEVYDPALGHVLGGGGRYDELMGRFGAPLPAAGFGLYLERVHIAQAEEEKADPQSSAVGRRRQSR